MVKGNEKYDADEIVRLYAIYNNTVTVGKMIGCDNETVARYLKRRGIKINRMERYVTQEEKDFLITNYQTYKNECRLPELAALMGKSYDVMKRIARNLGLTNKNDTQYLKFRAKEFGAPMEGKKHSKESLNKISESSKKMWAMPESVMRSEASLQKRSDAMRDINNNKMSGKRPSSVYSRTTKGWWENGEKKYYMLSKWEMNYAWYLEFLISKGEIKSWEYEVDTFWFEKIKRGVRSYTPDFKVVINSGSIEYHEVKGWMDDKSKTKIKRMAIYHPKVILKVVGEKEYKAIRKWANLIPNWIS
jgi:hypothetical protein